MPPDEDDSADSLRFVDILTTASSIAGARNTPQIGAQELVLAIRVVSGEMEIEDVGEAVHPLLMRGSAARPVVSAVRELVQIWYATIGGTADSVLAPNDAQRFIQELEALPLSDGGDGPGLE